MQDREKSGWSEVGSFRPAVLARELEGAVQATGEELSTSSQLWIRSTTLEPARQDEFVGAVEAGLQWGKQWTSD